MITIVAVPVVSTATSGLVPTPAAICVRRISVSFETVTVNLDENEASALRRAARPVATRAGVSLSTAV